MPRTIEIGFEFEGVDLRVTGRLYPGRPGVGPSFAHAGGDPPEGPEFVIEEIREDTPEGRERPDLLDALDEDDLLCAALEGDEDRRSALDEDRADAMREDRRLGWR